MHCQDSTKTDGVVIALFKFSKITPKSGDFGERGARGFIKVNDTQSAMTIVLESTKLSRFPDNVFLHKELKRKAVTQNGD